MLHNRHKYNTRLSSGKLKRKFLKQEEIEFSCDDDDSDYTDSDSDVDPNDIRENRILAKDKVAYYGFLNKIFPSNYSESRIKRIKRERLRNVKRR